MKAMIGSLATIFILVLAVIAAALMINGKTESFISRVSETEDDYEQISNLYEEYRSAERLLALCVSDDLLFNVEESFGDWLVCVKNNVTEDAKMAKSRLVRSLSHIKRLSGLNIKSIF